MVIEDAAQGIGVNYYGQHVGSFGDVGCFSFFADKTLTTGEGGYVVCKDKSTFDQLSLLRNQGRFDRGSFIHPAIGYNFRITDLQAAIGLVQLLKLDQIIERKRKTISTYADLLSMVPQVHILEIEEGSTHVPFRCVLIAEQAHELMKYLESHGIQSRNFFYPLHMQPCFTNWLKTQHSLQDVDYPNSIYGYENGLCLPIFPTLSYDDVSYIAGKVSEFYA